MKLASQSAENFPEPLYEAGWKLSPGGSLLATATTATTTVVASALGVPFPFGACFKDTWEEEPFSVEPNVCHAIPQKGISL